jgi:hypothetical protein
MAGVEHCLSDRLGLARHRHVCEERIVLQSHGLASLHCNCVLMYMGCASLGGINGTLRLIKLCMNDARIPQKGTLGLYPKTKGSDRTRSDLVTYTTVCMRECTCIW